jgi:hypothetical protein
VQLTLRIPKEVDRALKIPGIQKEYFLLKELGKNGDSQEKRSRKTHHSSANF